MVVLSIVCVAVLVAALIVLVLRLQRARLQQDVLQKKVAELGCAKVALQAQASHDYLTGVGNRRLLADRYFVAAERSKRSGKPFALLLIDLNDFKAVNDEYGHVAGDDVLIVSTRRLVAAVCRQRCAFGRRRVCCADGGV